ncbi:MAG: large conductance mechanosensitive channel protein MscL [Roseiarcus sp.]|jgi:large conductance mechanosensitive channel
MLEEFKAFALRGNVVDLAIGVIVGGAFGKIVDSLVNDIVMPVVGALGGADFSNYFFGLSRAVTATNLTDARKQGPVFAYGDFITVAVNFLIVGFVLFLLVKALNRLRKPPPAAPAAAPPSPEVVLLTEIRDALAKG